jgi:hypothetical protein
LEGAGERLTHCDSDPVAGQVKKDAPKFANIFGGVGGIISPSIVGGGEIHPFRRGRNAAVRGMAEGPLCAPFVPYAVRAECGSSSPILDIGGMTACFGFRFIQSWIGYRPSWRTVTGPFVSIDISTAY